MSTIGQGVVGDSLTECNNRLIIRVPFNTLSAAEKALGVIKQAFLVRRSLFLTSCKIFSDKLDDPNGPAAVYIYPLEHQETDVQFALFSIEDQLPHQEINRDFLPQWHPFPGNETFLYMFVKNRPNIGRSNEKLLGKLAAVENIQWDEIDSSLKALFKHGSWKLEPITRDGQTKPLIKFNGQGLEISDIKEVLLSCALLGLHPCYSTMASTISLEDEEAQFIYNVAVLMTGALYNLFSIKEFYTQFNNSQEVVSSRKVSFWLRKNLEETSVGLLNHAVMTTMQSVAINDENRSENRPVQYDPSKNKAYFFVKGKLTAFLDTLHLLFSDPAGFAKDRVSRLRSSEGIPTVSEFQGNNGRGIEGDASLQPNSPR